MTRLTPLLALTLALPLTASGFAEDRAQPQPSTIVEPAPAPPEAVAPRIQIAILLDNSGSMGGLIDQARTHLWSVVNQFAATRYQGRVPQLEVALYEYGYGKPVQLSGLTTDLDAISEKLFAIGINGGSEHCGQVIDAAVSGLAWSDSPTDYRAIFIAGNEPFTQGPVDYKAACKAAITKGIIVNTIHCGSEQAGMDGMWKDGALLADGSYLTINQNRATIYVEAPQDEQIARLNAELNDTYVYYGEKGQAAAARQEAQDTNASKLSPKASLDRAAAKASGQYRNAGWDLVDAVAEEEVDLAEVDAEDLPEAMRDMDVKQREAYVEQMAQKRAQIQSKIKELTAARNEHVQAERKRLAEESGEADLGEAMVTAVREQLKEKNYETGQAE